MVWSCKNYQTLLKTVRCSRSHGAPAQRPSRKKMSALQVKLNVHVETAPYSNVYVC